MSAPGTTGGRAAVAALLAHGVERVFCVPGESYLAVLDGLYDVGDRIQVVACRHESGAAFMAAAAARLTGRPGVVFVTRGPGATNASIALHVAQQASIPLVVGVGQVPRAQLGREAFQEVDYERFLGPLVKHVEQVSAAHEVAPAFKRAFRAAAGGRPGPAVVALPEDVLTEVSTGGVPPAAPASRRGLDAADLDALCAALDAARRPLILAGGGAW
ncbi:MAG: thiamine pyrophosphate-binding protein, partial [Gammaproteobacteria bacterium]